MLDMGSMDSSGGIEKKEKNAETELNPAEKIKNPEETAEDLLEKENHNEKIKTELKTASIWEREETLADLIKLSERTDLNFPGIIEGVRDEIAKLKKDLPAEKKTEIATKEKANQEKPTDRDPMLKSIEKELIEDWEKTNGEEILSARGQDFLFGSQKDPTTIAQKAEKVFAKRYPEEAKKHETAEKTRIYDNPEDDPVVEKMRKEIRRIANKDIEEAMNGGLGRLEAKENYPNFVRSTNGRVAMQQWEIFKRKYPEKALAYEEKIGPKKESLDRKVEPSLTDEASVEKPEESGVGAEEEITSDKIIYSTDDESEDDGEDMNPENISKVEDHKEAGTVEEDEDEKNKGKKKEGKSKKLGDLIPEKQGEEREEGVLDKNVVNEKKEVIPDGKNEKKVESLEESTQLLKEKIRDSKFCEHTKELVKKLEKNSMIDSRAVIFLDRAVKGMEDVIKEDSSASLKDINSYIEKVWGGINALPKDSRDIENANDAREVADILENIGESSSEIKIELGESKDKNLEEPTEYFVALNKLIEKKRGILLDKEKKP